MGHGKGPGEGGRPEGAQRSQGPGRHRGGPGTRREAATRATTAREGGAQGRGWLGRAKGTSHKGREALRREVQAVRCIPHDIQQMPAHHMRHNHFPPIYNIDPALGDLVPPQPPQLSRRQAPPHDDAPHDRAPAAREPQAEPARIAAAPAARNPSAEPARMAAAPVAQEPRPEPARGAVGAPRPFQARSYTVRERDAVPDPLGGETLLVVLEMYGWLNWATSGYQGYRPFDAVLLRRDGGNREVPPGARMARENHQKGPPGCDLRGMSRTGAGAAGFPGGGQGTLRHGRVGQCLAAPGPARRPHPLALPPEEPATAATPAAAKVEAQVTAGPTGDSYSDRSAPGEPNAAWRTQKGGGTPASNPGRPPQRAMTP